MKWSRGVAAFTWRLNGVTVLCLGKDVLYLLPMPIHTRLKQAERIYLFFSFLFIRFFHRETTSL